MNYPISTCQEQFISIRHHFILPPIPLKNSPPLLSCPGVDMWSRLANQSPLAIELVQGRAKPKQSKPVHSMTMM